MIPRVVPILVLMCASTVAAQELQPPSGWTWHADEPARQVNMQQVPEGAYRFVAMPPGFHVTTGPGLVAYHAEARADGRFTIQSEIFLFPNSGDGEYGIVLGGRDLGTPAASCLAVVRRSDGSFAVIRRAGEASTPVLAWARHDAVNARGQGVAKNLLAVRADDAALVITVNGTEVATVPLGAGHREGGFGLRVGRAVNLHAGTLDFTRHLAPAAAR